MFTIKITIEIKDKKDDSSSCKVTIKPQKDLSKVSETEKQTGAVVYNAITKALQDLDAK